MSLIGSVQYRYHEGSPTDRRSLLRRKRFVER